MCALAAFRKCVVGLEAIAPTAQIRRGSRRELVAGREEQRFGSTGATCANSRRLEARNAAS